MERNLDYRVEVSVAIYDPTIRREIRDMMELQWSDNVKARILKGAQPNDYVKREKGDNRVRSQMAMYDLIEEQQKMFRKKSE
jgi:polyphosphate kinase